MVCQACLAEPDERRWRRLRPQPAEVLLGRNCALLIARTAQDQARDLVDLGRLVESSRHMGGEVWQGPDAAYWFPDGVVLPAVGAAPRARPVIPPLPKVRDISRRK